MAPGPPMPPPGGRVALTPGVGCRHGGPGGGRIDPPSTLTTRAPVRWADLERDVPRLAARARALVVEPGVCLVVTVRRDGSPRLSPVEPLLLDGDLWLSMLWGSRKAADLRADDRILVHNIVTT